MLTGFRYRLALTDEQAELCRAYGGICRAVWNTGLDQRREMERQWQRGQDLPYCGYHHEEEEVNRAADASRLTETDSHSAASAGDRFPGPLRSQSRIPTACPSNSAVSA